MNKKPTFHIGNYRRLAQEQTIPVAPITVIVGNNSSGKSAILSAVDGTANVHRAASANIFDDNPNVHGLSFSNVCRGNNVERGVQLGFIDAQGFGFVLTLAQIKELGISPLRIVVYAQHEEVMQFDYCFEQNAKTPAFLYGPEEESPEYLTTPLHYLKCKPNVAAIKRLIENSNSNPNSLDLGNLRSKLEAIVFLEFRDYLDTDLFLRCLEQSETIGFGIELMRGPFSITTPHFFRVHEDNGVLTYWIGEKSEYVDTISMHYRGPMFDPDHVLPFIFKICIEHLKLQEVRYLPELRIRPSAYVDPSYPYASEWYTGGGEYYKVLRQNPSVLNQVNRWLKDTDTTLRSYEFRVVDLIDKSQYSSSANLNDFVSSTGTQDTDLSHSVEQRLKLWDDASGVYVGLDEVGTGISQVTPVLAMLYGSENSLLQIEQPELHLHPKLQSRLADAMIDSTAQGNTVMVETHSEHLILRLLSLVRSGKMIQSLGRPLNPADLQIIFVEGNGSQSRVIPIDVTPSGNLSRPWPNGFFDDSLDLED